MVGGRVRDFSATRVHSALDQHKHLRPEVGLHRKSRKYQEKNFVPNKK